MAAQGGRRLRKAEICRGAQNVSSQILVEQGFSEMRAESRGGYGVEEGAHLF